MSAIEFIAMLTSTDIAWLVFLQMAFFLVFYHLVSARQNSIIDPVTLPIFFAASAWSTVVFLYVHNLSSLRLFIMFVVTGLAFFVGYLLVAPKLPAVGLAAQKIVVRGPIDDKRFTLMGVVVTLVVLLCISINVSIFGFGIEHENRLEIYTDSAGLGVLKRIVDALMPVSIFFLIYQVARPGKFRRMIALAILLILSIFAVLDGSKSGLVAIFLILAATLSWLNRNVDYRIRPIDAKIAVIAFSAALLIAILVLTFQLDAFHDFEKFGSVVVVLFYRVFLAADIYVLGFPNDTIDRIVQTSNPLLIMFSDLLLTLRLISLDVTPIGTQLYNYLTPVFEVGAGGPNAHLSIYVYYLFGEYLSPVFCFIFGMAIGWVRKLYNRPSQRLVYGACVTALMVNTCAFIVDPSYTMHRLTNLLVFLLPFYLIFSVKGAGGR